MVERAAAVGAHVLCEKPLATTESDAWAMIDACARAGAGPLLGGFDATTARPRWGPGGDDLDAAMLEEFLEAARTGRRPHPDGEAGLRSLRIVLAAYASPRTGQPVPLPGTTEDNRVRIHPPE